MRKKSTLVKKKVKSVIKKIDSVISKLQFENERLLNMNSQFTDTGMWIEIIIADNNSQIKRLQTAKQILK